MVASKDSYQRAIDKAAAMGGARLVVGVNGPVYTVRGSGFLHHMVRNLVGTFILVGKATLAVQDITRILEARNRSAAGATAPASGLYLVEVEYEGDRSL